MEAPKFVTCPECDEKYDDTRKRRIIDSCGHPRCFSCLFADQPCTVCAKLLRGRTRSWMGRKDSLSSTDEDKDHDKTYPTSNGLFHKEHYLRALYSYIPGSKENISHPRDLNSRRNSLDVNTLKQLRRTNLGRRSTSDIVFPTVPERPSFPQDSSKACFTQDPKYKRNSLPSSSNRLAISGKLYSSTQNLSSSPETMRFFDEILKNVKLSKTGDDRNSISHSEESSRPSSGYWSGRESDSDQDTGNNSLSKSDYLSEKTRRSMKELAILDEVLSGKSSAWENTKAVFRLSSPKRANGFSKTGENMENFERVEAAAALQFKKSPDSQNIDFSQIMDENLKGL